MVGDFQTSGSIPAVPCYVDFYLQVLDDFRQCVARSQGAAAAELRRMFVLLAVGTSARPHSAHENSSMATTPVV